MAVDPATHVAAIATSCAMPASDRAELTLLDLTTGTTSRVFQHVVGLPLAFHGGTSLRGGDSPVIGIDPINHLILQRSIFCPQAIGAYDLNARPCLNLYDERGGLVKTIPGLLPDGFWDPQPQFNGVNGTLRTGIAMGQQALGVSIDSFSVQPYSY